MITEPHYYVPGDLVGSLYHNDNTYVIVAYGHGTTSDAAYILLTTDGDVKDSNTLRSWSVVRSRADNAAKVSNDG